jgi:hypothetical protein
MKRGIQEVTRSEQPKPPITKSVAEGTIGEYLRIYQKYNLYFREISRGLWRKQCLHGSNGREYRKKFPEVHGY